MHPWEFCGHGYREAVPRLVSAQDHPRSWTYKRNNRQIPQGKPTACSCRKKRYQTCSSLCETGRPVPLLIINQKLGHTRVCKGATVSLVATLISVAESFAPKGHSKGAKRFIKRKAVRIPSTAALVIPPAYPAPSPQGYTTSQPGAMPSSERRTRTGAEVRVSGPVKIACG